MKGHNRVCGSRTWDSEINAKIMSGCQDSIRLREAEDVLSKDSKPGDRRGEGVKQLRNGHQIEYTCPRTVVVRRRRIQDDGLQV